jgi:hypothetical protein
VEPRDPTPEEIELVKLLLPDGAFPNVDIYRAQADHLRVTGKCSCGCPTVNFTVDAAHAQQATFHGDPLLPIEAEAGEGENYVQLILFAGHGWLESLELVYYSQLPPANFPAQPELRLVTRPPRIDTAAGPETSV